MKIDGTAKGQMLFHRRTCARARFLSLSLSVKRKTENPPRRDCNIFRSVSRLFLLRRERIVHDRFAASSASVSKCIHIFTNSYEFGPLVWTKVIAALAERR